MAGRGVEFHVNFNHLGQVIANLPGATSSRKQRVIRQTVAYARSFARVRTGYMRDNIVETLDGAVSRAPYSAYNEFGTHKMLARPFMRPAAEKAGAEVAQEFSGFENDLL